MRKRALDLIKIRHSFISIVFLEEKRCKIKKEDMIEKIQIQTKF